LVSNNDLNVSPLIKTGARIDRPPLGKHTFQGIHSWKTPGFEDAVRAPNYGAVKIAPTLVLSVCGQ
jgi:hypothetical protein